jgi:hypothetical protein
MGPPQQFITRNQPHPLHGENFPASDINTPKEAKIRT